MRAKKNVFLAEPRRGVLKAGEIVVFLNIEYSTEHWHNHWWAEFIGCSGRLVLLCRKGVEFTSLFDHVASI